MYNKYVYTRQSTSQLAKFEKGEISMVDLRKEIKEKYMYEFLDSVTWLLIGFFGVLLFKTFL